jgi:hypothetical protein
MHPYCIGNGTNCNRKPIDNEKNISEVVDKWEKRPENRVRCSAFYKMGQ